jgi:endonuclease/exonuclease/phosphatase family metal-dependent hydrolase
MKRVLAQVALAACVGAACSHAVNSSSVASSRIAASCRDSAAHAPRVTWIAPPELSEKARLDSWCAAVGPVVVRDRSASRDARLEDVAFVSWNVHVGLAEVERFVGDVREGRLTRGHRPNSIVLMLQEAVRSGDVPVSMPDGATAAGWIGSVNDDAAEIERVGADLNLSVFYVPSMRNGGPTDRRHATDRGNAILSTLPLSAPVAIELPGDGQRRVAVAATTTVAADGRAVPIVVGAAHLATRASSKTLWVFGAMGLRQLQAKSLASALGDGPMILGADLNSWIGGPHEPAARDLLRLFPGTPAGPRQATAAGGLVLDYMFFRPPAGWQAHLERAPERYGSDHYPLIGWLTQIRASRTLL